MHLRTVSAPIGSCSFVCIWPSARTIFSPALNTPLLPWPQSLVGCVSEFALIVKFLMSMWAIVWLLCPVRITKSRQQAFFSMVWVKWILLVKAFSTAVITLLGYKQHQSVLGKTGLVWKMPFISCITRLCVPTGFSSIGMMVESALVAELIAL